jgi:hypothetical protein
VEHLGNGTWTFIDRPHRDRRHASARWRVLGAPGSRPLDGLRRTSVVRVVEEPVSIFTEPQLHLLAAPAADEDTSPRARQISSSAHAGTVEDKTLSASAVTAAPSLKPTPVATLEPETAPMLVSFACIAPNNV